MELRDRFTNDEFIEILPHLELDHVLLTQVFISKWTHLYDVSLQKSIITCTACDAKVQLCNARRHLFDMDHISALRSHVSQIYHPFFTYGKGDIQLVRGEFLAKKFRKQALTQLNQQMRCFKKDCLKAHHIAECIQSQVDQKEGEQLFQLLNLARTATVVVPDDMLIKACIPFKDIPKLMYCLHRGEWKPAVNYNKLVKNGLFCCNLCKTNSSKIPTLNGHFRGLHHRRNQLQVLDLRYEGDPDVNKNCIIRFGDSFSLSVREKGKQLFQSEIYPECNQRFLGLSDELKAKLNDLNRLIPDGIMSITNMDGPETKSTEILGHIGVEYVLKIIKSGKGKETMYECGLCEFYGEESKMQRHIISYDHRKKYLDIHYSATIKKYENALGHMKFNEFRGVMGEIVQIIAIEIEKKYGRGLPFTVTEKDYRTRRGDLIADVYSLSHASQTSGPSFSNAVSPQKIRELKVRSVELAERSYKSIDQIVFTKAPIGKTYMDQAATVGIKTGSATENPKYGKYGSGRRSRSISPRPRKRTRSRSPHNYYSNVEDCQHNNIWDIYRQELAIAANEIELAYVQYRNNPESHPLYEEEWNGFWQKRKVELEREGVDYRAYNFQGEWVQYFKQRIEFLFGEALHKSKSDIRDKLKIPQDAEEDCDRTDYSVSQATDLNSPDTEGGRFSYQHERDASYKVKKAKSEVDSRLNDNHTRVVRVLRLITALEDHLGSLGSKIMDLLSKALEMEKYFDGDVKKFEAKILNASNCKVLEMSMEKLKGILFAGFLDEKKTMAFNRIIRLTTELLDYAEEMGWRTEPVRFGFQNATKNNGNISMSNAKSLSDTLMDLVGSQKGNKNVEEPLFSTACPPPPAIGSNSATEAYKCQPMASGLASFDTKLSLDALPFPPRIADASKIAYNSFSNTTNNVRTAGGNTNIPNYVQNMHANNVPNRRIGDINRSNMKWKHWGNMN